MNRPSPEAAHLRHVPQDQILHRLREMFGEDRAQVQTGRHFRVAGEAERIVAFPNKIEELSEMLRLASTERWRVIPAGAGTWLEVGNRPSHFHLVVSTAKLNRVLEYEPADLTATVEAGCALQAFNRLAAEHRQFIPLDPFGEASATIGGIIATAGSGPLQCAYGTPRDWLIGIRVVHVDGSITRAGGKVVKNVAGYDLCKLYTGSFGTLAVISEMTFKLRALPPAEKTLIFYSGELGSLTSLISRITDSDLQPAAIELLSPADAGSLPIEPGKFVLALRFLSEPEAIDSQIGEVSQLGSEFKRTVMSAEDAATFWRAYHASEIDDRWDYRLRMSALPADLKASLDEIQSILPETGWRAHAANGVIRIHGEKGWLDRLKTKERARKLADLRHHAQSRGGRLVILRATTDIIDQLDVWGEVGQTDGIMRALKEKYDPLSLLNPGRFVAGI